jgi:hypothetical protein
MVSFRQDTGNFEYYAAAFGTANPGGRDSAGWYSNTKSDGLIPINPATVTLAPTSSAGTFDSIGELSFSAASTIIVNNVFTSQFRNYKIFINITGVSSGLPALLLRYRAGATTNLSSVYFQGGIISRSNGTGGNNYASNADSQHYLAGLAPSNPQSPIELTVFNPFPTQPTSYVAHSQGIDGGVYSFFSAGGQHNSSTSFDGFEIRVLSGNITGTLSVYGINS